VPTFELSQSIYDLDMIKSLHTYLGVGRLVINRVKKNRRFFFSVSIVVTSIKEILTVILPHFDKYPLIRNKFLSYLIFRSVVLAMKDNTHHTVKGFLEILNVCYFMNNTSTRSVESYNLIIDTILKSIHTQLNIELSNVETTCSLMLDFSPKISTNITADFLAGLIDGLKKS